MLGFKAECPSGVAREDTFRQVYAQFFPPEANPKPFARLLFHAIDTSQAGHITFEDFALTMSTLCRGETSEKLRWAFSIYDQDRDGRISKLEFLNVVLAVYALLGPRVDPPVDDWSIVDKAEHAFRVRIPDFHISFLFR
ncbi:unnamed protein product [Darwinula stevensoni]|uniref:EF-hand domain-containing protein n=1 Tax=Darwinula stevensoni TaxID=69355 RepID=A0A7R9FR11_9CRUS|nr:unnamed protein product [Darwinula stevensoni]CAG0900162.1 unnamed protein product [Darwinula stevensoni]